MKLVKNLCYILIQCTWGILQTLCGFAVFLWYRRAPHRWYHGAVGTEWKKRTGLSLGLFFFVPEGEYGKDFYVHEYGHTVQSLLLGPLYLFVVGLPSVLWCNLPYYKKLRQRKQIPYESMVMERSASYWGARVLDSDTGKKKSKSGESKDKATLF